MKAVDQMTPEEKTKALKERLTNFKFEQALRYLHSGIKEDETETINALARCFGNTGWILGDFGQIVDYAVAYVQHLIDYPNGCDGKCIQEQEGETDGV